MNQPNRFQWEVRPCALGDQILQGQTCRITVLESRLVRLEYAPDGIFEDRASQMAFYRDFPEQHSLIKALQELLSLTVSPFIDSTFLGKSQLRNMRKE